MWQIEFLNWLGDTSSKGMSESFGMMVNYRYKMGDVERNHERYHSESRVEVSKHVYELYVSI